MAAAVSHHPEPTRKDHQRFCQVEGWTQVRNASGTVGHHLTYELTLADGSILRTQISHPPNRTGYGPSLWAHILRDQLQVSAEEFWACVQREVRPSRGRPRKARPSIPAAIVRQLLNHGVSETEVAGMSRDEAIRRATELWSREP